MNFPYRHARRRRNRVAVGTAVVLSAVLAAPMAAHAVPNGVERIGGADRYAVSAAVSAHEFAPTPLVFVASGEGYADALSASASAGAQKAPVLLVSKSSVPTAVSQEIDRLNPDVIVIVGGTATIGAEVETALGEHADEVVRVTGVDRYAVSARLSAQGNWAANPVAYVASGEVFPDALSASAAAGQLGGPVLLVQKGTIPSSIALELARLKPSKVIVLGGVNTVSDSVVESLRGIVRDTVRIDGADRYTVSATASQKTFAASGGTVFVASGEVFPDALSGSAAAIRAHGPVLLVMSTSIPTAVAAELTRLQPKRIVVLGGERTVSPAVASALDQYIAR